VIVLKVVNVTVHESPLGAGPICGVTFKKRNGHEVIRWFSINYPYPFFDLLHAARCRVPKNYMVNTQTLIGRRVGAVVTMRDYRGTRYAWVGQFERLP